MDIFRYLHSSIKNLKNGKQFNDYLVTQISMIMPRNMFLLFIACNKHPPASKMHSQRVRLVIFLYVDIAFALL